MEHRRKIIYTREELAKPTEMEKREKYLKDIDPDIHTEYYAEIIKVCCHILNKLKEKGVKNPVVLMLIILSSVIKTLEFFLTAPESKTQGEKNGK